MGIFTQNEQPQMKVPIMHFFAAVQDRRRTLSVHAQFNTSSHNVLNRESASLSSMSTSIMSKDRQQYTRLDTNTWRIEADRNYECHIGNEGIKPRAEGIRNFAPHNMRWHTTNAHRIHKRL